MNVGDDSPEAGGDGGANGECHDMTEWKDSVDEKPESELAMVVDFRRGDSVRFLEGGLVISERSGGAVMDLPKLSKT